MKTSPYTYLVGWADHKTFYYGVQYKDGCSPENLFRTYFTSSKLVHEKMKEWGPPDVVEIRKIFKTKDDAIAWEIKVQRRMKVLNDDRWLNRNISGAIKFTNEIRQKMREKKKERVCVTKDGKKKLIETSRLAEFLEQGWIRGHGQNVAGEKNGMYGKKHSPETLKKIGDKKRGICTLTEAGREAKRKFIKENNPMNNPEVRARYDEKMKTVLRRARKVYYNGAEYRTVKEANEHHPHLKYQTLYWMIKNKKDGWSFDHPSVPND